MPRLEPLGRIEKLNGAATCYQAATHRRSSVSRDSHPGAAPVSRRACLGNRQAIDVGQLQSHRPVPCRSLAALLCSRFIRCPDALQLIVVGRILRRETEEAGNGIADSAPVRALEAFDELSHLRPR